MMDWQKEQLKVATGVTDGSRKSTSRIEAMKLAMQWCEYLEDGFTDDSVPLRVRVRTMLNDLQPKLRQAIATEESSATQEPVIFYRCKGCQHAYETEPPSSCDCMSSSGFEKIEYYTHPQPKAEDTATKLAAAIRDAAVKAGICDPNAELTGPHLLMLLDDLANAAQPKAEQCVHRLVDVTNPVVKSGYMCIDCGAVFRAAFESQPKAEQEPVAWRAPNWGHSPDEFVYRDFDDPVIGVDGKPSPNNEPLYLHPQPKREWVGLTDEERVTVQYEAHKKGLSPLEFMEEHEAKLKEKNT